MKKNKWIKKLPYLIVTGIVSAFTSFTTMATQQEELQEDNPFSGVRATILCMDPELQEFILTRENRVVHLTPNLLRGAEKILKTVKNSVSDPEIQFGAVRPSSFCDFKYLHTIARDKGSLGEFTCENTTYSLKSCLYFSINSDKANDSAYDYLSEILNLNSKEQNISPSYPLFERLVDEDHSPYHQLERRIGNGMLTKTKQNSKPALISTINTYFLLQIQEIYKNS